MGTATEAPAGPIQAGIEAARAEDGDLVPFEDGSLMQDMDMAGGNHRGPHGTASSGSVREGVVVGGGGRGGGGDSSADRMVPTGYEPEMVHGAAFLSRGGQRPQVPAFDPSRGGPAASTALSRGPYNSKKKKLQVAAAYGPLSSKAIDPQPPQRLPPTMVPAGPPGGRRAQMRAARIGPSHVAASRMMAVR